MHHTKFSFDADPPEVPDVCEGEWEEATCTSFTTNELEGKVSGAAIVVRKITFFPFAINRYLLTTHQLAITNFNWRVFGTSFASSLETYYQALEDCPTAAKNTDC